MTGKLCRRWVGGVEIEAPLQVRASFGKSTHRRQRHSHDAVGPRDGLRILVASGKFQTLLRQPVGGSVLRASPVDRPEAQLRDKLVLERRCIADKFTRVQVDPPYLWRCKTLDRSNCRSEGQVELQFPAIPVWADRQASYHFDAIGEMRCSFSIG